MGTLVGDKVLGSVAIAHHIFHPDFDHDNPR